MKNDKQQDFAERLAVVTGAGAGIGRATVDLLAARGAKVICVDRDEAAILATIDRVRKSGGYAEGVSGDVCNASTFEHIASVAEKMGGSIDILANIAGAWEVRSFAELDIDAWRKLLDINMLSVVRSVDALLPLLKKSDSARIVNVSATDGFRGSVAMPHYAAAKAAVVNVTKSYAMELSKFGILVNCVSPGAIATERATQDAWLEERRKTVPLGRLGTAADVANLIVFLASQNNSFTTGAVIPVNGGLYMP